MHVFQELDVDLYKLNPREILLYLTPQTRNCQLHVQGQPRESYFAKSVHLSVATAGGICSAVFDSLIGVSAVNAVGVADRDRGKVNGFHVF